MITNASNDYKAASLERTENIAGHSYQLYSLKFDGEIVTDCKRSTNLCSHSTGTLPITEMWISHARQTCFVNHTKGPIYFELDRSGPISVRSAIYVSEETGDAYLKSAENSQLFRIGELKSHFFSKVVSFRERQVPWDQLKTNGQYMVGGATITSASTVGLEFSPEITSNGCPEPLNSAIQKSIQTELSLKRMIALYRQKLATWYKAQNYPECNGVGTYCRHQGAWHLDTSLDSMERFLPEWTLVHEVCRGQGYTTVEALNCTAKENSENVQFIVKLWNALPYTKDKTVDAL
jgi:hypothetical protein